MTQRIVLNGLGRIGKLVLRRLIDLADTTGIEIAAVNDIAGDAAQHALLMEFDSVHGRWHPCHAEGETLVLNAHHIPLTRHANPADLNLDDIDLVIDCTGVFKTAAKLQPYFDAGVPRVLVSAPVKDAGALNLVYGVNHDLYDGTQKIVTAASCTTNCIAPVIAVLREHFGIKHGSFTTIHDVTNTQTIVDRPHKDPRRARSALMNLIPTTTGSAKAIMAIFPELEGRLTGHAVRVPLLNASLTDLTLELARETTAEEINAAFAAAANGPLKGILGFEPRPLVSTDYTNDDRSTIIDGPSTVVVQGTHAKIYAWYDNEWGYACRTADIARMMLA